MYLHTSTPTPKCIFTPHTSSKWNLHTSHPAPPGCEWRCHVIPLSSNLETEMEMVEILI